MSGKDLRVGDLIIIHRPHGSKEEVYNIDPGWTEYMDKYDGASFVVTERILKDMDKNDVYYDGFWFNIDWLEIVDEPDIDDEDDIYSLIQ